MAGLDPAMTLIEDLVSLIGIAAASARMTHHSGYPKVSYPKMSKRALTYDFLYNPIWRLARSFMISSVPPPMALTFTSR